MKQDKERHEVKGSTEKTASDRLRERKLKKVKQRVRKKEKERREKLVDQLNPGLGNKYSKEKALQKLEKESRTDAGGLTMIKVNILSVTLYCLLIVACLCLVFSSLSC